MSDTLRTLKEFGTDWLVIGPLCAFALVGMLVMIRKGEGRNLVLRFADGASRLTGYPNWSASGAVTLLFFGLPMAALGFYWDVAWHIDKGRDEFLMSPPHVALLLAFLGILAAGAVSTYVATAEKAEVGWRVGRYRVPRGAAGLLIGGFIAQVGYFVDELWHWAYGLDVSMWGPTHLTMVSAAAFSPLAVWALLGEAGPTPRRAAIGRITRGVAAGATIVGLSAWQLEFDLGVPQWQQLYHPVLIAMTAALGLSIARGALGRGGALIAAAVAIAIRAVSGLVVDGLGLNPPQYPLYLTAAVVIEVVAFVAERRRLSTIRQGLIAGLAVGTIGLAGAAAWTHVFGAHPWTTTLFPGVLLAVVVAVASALLGIAAGRIVRGHPSGLRAGAAVACGLALVAGIVLPVFRHVPDLTATIRTTPADPGYVNVTVEMPPGSADEMDRFEVLSWQGGSSQRAELIPVGQDLFEADRPVPVTGTWKSMVHFVSRDQLGSIPVFMPRDDAIEAAEIPLVAERTQPFGSLPRALQRESRSGGPAWPAVIAYGWVLLSVGGLLASIVAAYIGIERRRRAGRSPNPTGGSLEGRRVVVTGAAGGIGSALVDALETNGARIVGIDRAGSGDTIAADLTDADAISSAMREAAQRLGGIDVLVNNAGIGTAGDSGAMPDTAARATVDVNLFGTWHATAAAMPLLLESGGQVVNIVSGLAFATVPHSAAYTASKRAMLAYSDVLRTEYAGRIAVSSVLPGYIKTAIHDAPAAVGGSLDGIVRAEPVDGAVAAVLCAIETRRREVASTPSLRLQLAAARHLPRTVDAVLRRRIRTSASVPTSEPAAIPRVASP